MCLGKKSRNSPFSVVELYEGKSRKYVISSTFNGYNSKTKEREFQVHIFD